MNMPAEYILRLFALNPGTQSSAAGMFPRSKFIQRSIQRRHVGHEIEQRQSNKCRQSLANMLLRVLAGRLAWSDVAITEPGPVRFPNAPDRAMKIDESKSRTKFPDLVMRLMIAGQHPDPLLQRRQDLSATIQAFPKSRK